MSITIAPQYLQLLYPSALVLLSSAPSYLTWITFESGPAMDSEASRKSHASSLPQEIIDAIIDNFALVKVGPLYRTYLETLKACSLVCHAFLPRSQAHIFSVVGFSVNASVFGERRAEVGRRALGLIDLLLSKPHIAQNVRGISVDWETENAPTFMWRIDDMDLLNHMQILCLNITSLCVQAFQPVEGGNQTGYAPPSVFHSPVLAGFKAITCIRLDNVEVDVSTIAQYPGLRDLSCSNVTFISVPRPVTRTNVRHVARLIIYSLQFDWTTDDSIDSLASLVEGTHHEYPLVLDLSQLRSFKHAQHHLADQMAHLIDLGRILRRCVSLKKLDLRGSWLAILLRKLDKDSAIFRLSQLPKLAELIVDAMVIDFQEDSWEVEHNPLTDSPFLDIINLLNTIPTKNNLIKLKLDFVFRPSRRDPSIANMAATVNWRQLATQVVRIANGDALEVKLTIGWISPRELGIDSAYGGDTTFLEEKDQVSKTLHGTFDEDLRAEMQSLQACPWVKMNIVYGIC